MVEGANADMKPAVCCMDRMVWLEQCVHQPNATNVGNGAHVVGMKIQLTERIIPSSINMSVTAALAKRHDTAIN